MEPTTTHRPPELADQPLPVILKELGNDMSLLIRQEFELLKAETTEKGKKAGVGLGAIGGAGVMALLGLMALTATLILVLDLFLPTWLAALIVTVAWLAGAAVLGLFGKNKVQEATPAAPEQTIETVKEDVSWAKTQMQSAKR